MPSPASILCIDDDRLVLKFERAFLEHFNYSVLTAPNGAEGLRMAALHEVDIVILDYEMPDMNGAIVASAIRKLRPKALIIMVSGADVPRKVQKLADAFIAKVDFSRQLVPVLTSLSAAP